jgi:hypothetical protein
MIDDFIAKPLSEKEIELKALAWRDALRVRGDWAPDLISLLEARLPKLFPSFALVVRPDSEMVAVEGYTEFNPPQIVVSESVYKLARRFDGRARMTLAHELGHLVMHPGASKMRTVDGNKTSTNVKPYQSAEWQARKFGAFFLLPTDIVMQFVTPNDLAEGCCVSFQAASIRFAEVGHIPPDAPAECVEDLIAKYAKD